METAALIAVAALLVLANGFFVLAEFSLVKVRATRIEQLARKGERRARAAHEAVQRLDAYLAATQLGVTLASLALGWIGEPAFAAVFSGILDLVGLHAGSIGAHTISAALAFCWITFLHILFGELAPKSIAIRRPEAAALFVAIPMRFFHYVFFVPLFVLNESSNAVLRLFGFSPLVGHDAIASEEELKLVLGRSQAAGALSFNRLLLIENAFDLGELRVRDAMVPIERCAVLDLSRPREELLAFVRERKRTRYPVLSGSPPAVAGFVHMKDVALEALAERGPIDLARLVRPIHRLPADQPLEAALRDLQRKRVLFSAVQDETGRTVGIITFKDIMEELVGDIEDEFERERDAPLGFATVLQPVAVLLEPRAGDASALIDLLLEAARRARPELDVGAARVAVRDRESSARTLLAHGIAIPHARLAGLGQPVVALARSRAGIPFGAATETARIVVLVLTPLESPTIQLRLLRRIALVLESEFVRMRILEAATVQELVEALRMGDADAHA